MKITEKQLLEILNNNIVAIPTLDNEREVITVKINIDSKKIVKELNKIIKK